MFYRRRNQFRKKVKSSTKRKYAKKSVSPIVKKYVKRAIHKNIENKEIIDYFNNQTIQTLSSGTNTGGNCRILLPLPAQGTADNQRIGNQIKIAKAYIKGHINIKPYDVMTNPVGTPLLVKMWVFRDLQTSGTAAISGGSLTSYFDGFFRGNGTALPFQGYPIDMDLPIDDNHFKVLASKTFKIGASNATSTGPVGTGGYFDNSPMSVPFYFNWGKYVKKQIKWIDGGSYPANANCYIVVQAVRADGASSGSYQMAEWHAVNHIKFEDA